MTSHESSDIPDSLPAQTMWSVQARTRCVLEQAAALPFWNQDYTQLSPGSFKGEIDSITTPDIQLFRESMNRSVDELASAPKNAYVIGIPNGMDGEAYWGLTAINSNSMITLNKNAELTFRTSHNSEISAAVIQADRLEHYAETIMETDLRALFRRIKPTEALLPKHAIMMREMLYGSFRWTHKMPLGLSDHAAWQHFEDDVLTTCVAALASTRPSSHKSSDHRIHRYAVNRVRDLVLASPLCPPTIGEICEELRISRRSLNHAFTRVLGISPVAYMRSIRLNRVRAALLQESATASTIAEIAMRWGFWHMSLFARYYRELFGELPSETRDGRTGRYVRTRNY